MAARGREFTVNVRYNSCNPTPITVNTSWTIGKVKDEISRKVGKPRSDIRIIFQGKEIHDDMVLEHCDLGNGSVLHAVKGLADLPSFTINAEGPPGTLTVPVIAIPDQYKENFFVFCKRRGCSRVQPGKIRVRCRKCLSGAFTVDRDPENWTDVLTPQAISGKCHQEGCNGTKAEFYFKCKAHDVEEMETSAPLSLIMPNPDQVVCISCLEPKNPVLVFPCQLQHCICLDCFRLLCVVKLNDRDFVLKEGTGWTLPCQGGCPDVYIEDCHHFKIMGNDQFSRYEKFAAEEYVLQCGGLLCPNPQCGTAILLENDNVEVTCYRQGNLGGCGMVFCRLCREAYHTGPCHSAPPSIVASASERLPHLHNADRARFDIQSRQMIAETTKGCPNCNIPVEKNGGCNHMTCKCRHEWCWICNKKWGRECQDSHWFSNQRSTNQPWTLH